MADLVPDTWFGEELVLLGVSEGVGDLAFAHSRVGDPDEVTRVPGRRSGGPGVATTAPKDKGGDDPDVKAAAAAEQPTGCTGWDVWLGEVAATLFIVTRVIGGEFPAAMEVLRLRLRACWRKACLPAAPGYDTRLITAPLT